MADREPPPALRVGHRVAKTTGDYTFEGVVVAVFYKRDRLTRRFVVENDDGLMFIFNDRQLTPVEE